MNIYQIQIMYINYKFIEKQPNSKYCGWPNYYTHFVFVSGINSPNIDNIYIKNFS